LVEAEVGEQVLLQVQWEDQAVGDQVPWFRIQWVLQELRVKVIEVAAAFKEQIQAVVVVVAQPLLVMMVLME
jgi:hypothetical protein